MHFNIQFFEVGQIYRTQSPVHQILNHSALPSDKIFVDKYRSRPSFLFVAISNPITAIARRLSQNSSGSSDFFQAGVPRQVGRVYIARLSRSQLNALPSRAEGSLYRQHKSTQHNKLETTACLIMPCLITLQRERGREEREQGGRD